MDDFEREGLKKTLEIYASITINDDGSSRYLSVSEVIELVAMYTFLPQPGCASNFMNRQFADLPTPGHPIDYKLLLVNEEAYNCYLERITLQPEGKDLKGLTQNILETYLEIKSSTWEINIKPKLVKGFLENVLPTCEVNTEVEAALIIFNNEIFANVIHRNHEIRDEDYLTTAFLLIIGLYKYDEFYQSVMNECSKDTLGSQ